MFIGNNTSVLTPCVGQCELDENEICAGCYRSSSEISNWINKSEDEKIAIIIRCKKLIASHTQSS